MTDESERPTMKRTKHLTFQDYDRYTRVRKALTRMVGRAVEFDRLYGPVREVTGHWDVSMNRGFVRVTMEVEAVE